MAPRPSYQAFGTSQLQQRVGVGERLGSPMGITVTAPQGGNAEGVAVIFSTPTMGASGTFTGGVTIAAVRTDKTGNATSPPFTANTIAGTYTVSVLVAGQNEVNFRISNVAGPAAAVKAYSGFGQAAPVTTAFAAPLVAMVTDSYGNPVGGANVTFSIPGDTGSARFDGLTSLTDVATGPNGKAASPLLVAGTKAGPLTVTAHLSALESAADFPLTIIPGAPSELKVVTGSDQTAVVGSDFASPLSILAIDHYGNPVAGTPVSFSLPQSGPSGVLAGSVQANTLTDTNGVAVAPELQAGTVAGTYTAKAACGTSTVEFSLTNLPGGVAQLMPTVGQGQSTRVMTDFAQPLSVRAEDSYGNPTPGTLVEFALPPTGPSAAFPDSGRIATVKTDGGGLASSPPLVADTEAGTISVAVTSGTARTSITLTTQPGPPARLDVFGGSGQAAPIGTAFARSLKAEAVDDYGNPVGGVGVDFSSPDNGPTGSFQGGSSTAHTTTDGNGVADAPTFTAGQSTGDYIVVATSAQIPNPATFALDNSAPTGSFSVSAAAAGRFLEQSGFGPTPAEIAAVESLGFRPYLEEQFAIQAYRYPELDDDSWNVAAIQSAFFRDAVSGADQLHERLTLALASIFAVNPSIGQPPAEAVAHLLNIIQQDELSTFSTLLHDVSLSPAIGVYLSVAGNVKAGPGGRPNENYARELMQLFTIGLDRLNQDGTPIMGADGKPVPTYDQETVEGNAAVLTGWSLSGSAQLTAPMQANETAHDEGPKTIVDGIQLPAGRTADEDLDALLTALVNDPNTGPFICKQLIQFLVTSNPSPSYVARVASVFNDDGAGTRGDMKAVISAILLDPEARSDANQGGTHLMAPALFVATLLHELGASTDGVAPTVASAAMGQNLFEPPSVFGYYSPSFTVHVSGATVVAPEFSLESLSADLARQSFVHNLVAGSLGPGTTVDVSGFLPASQAGAGQLVDALNGRLMDGNMPEQMIETIAAAIGGDASPMSRIADAIELIMTSPQYIVEH